MHIHHHHSHQRGLGVGTFLARLYHKTAPYAKAVASNPLVREASNSVRKSMTRAGLEAARDVVNGKDATIGLKKRLKETQLDVANNILHAAMQSGSGYKKRTRKNLKGKANVLKRNVKSKVRAVKRRKLPKKKTLSKTTVDVFSTPLLRHR